MLQVDNIVGKRSVVFFLFFLFASISFAQNRSISGYIYLKDKKSEPVSFANVVVPGTTIGTMSDFEGKFKLQIPESTKELDVSAIGYLPVKVYISSNRSYYNIELEEDIIEIDEIVVDAKINPALLIQKKIARSRKDHDPDMLKIYSCEKYMKHQFFLSEVDSSFMNSVFFRKHPEAFILHDVNDSLKSLPISFHELITEEFKKKFPPKQRIVIKGEQYTGVTAFKESEINNFVGIIETNFYQNYLHILEKDFVSPFANIGPVFYEYYIKDTLVNESGTYYKIKFKPRREKELVFYGYFYVNKADYSVWKVDAEITPYTNINFIKELKIQQEYQKVNDTAYFFKDEKVVVDFVYTPSKDTTEDQMLIRSVKAVKYSNVSVDIDSLETIAEDAIAYEVIHEERESRNDTSFWNQHRAESLDTVEQQALEAIETVNNIGVVNLSDKLLDMGLNGYIGTKYIDWGPWEEIFQINSVEGFRAAVIGRTSGEWTGRHAISGFLAYGTRDQLLKYGGGYAVELPGGRYQQVGVKYADNTISIGNYKNYVQYLRENLISPTETNIITGLASRGDNYKLYRLREAEFRYEREWTPGFINRFNYNYFKHYIPEFVPFTTNNGADSIPFFHSQEFTLNTRLTWDEKVITKHFRRVYMGTSKPRLNLNFTLGTYTIDDKTEQYFKLRAVVRHYFPLWSGRLMCNYEAGYIWGTLPYPLLEIPRGNESFGYARYSYNLVNKMEFVHDHFLGTIIEYATSGIVFNYIPLIKRMNLRENVTFKGMWGGASDRHRTVMDYPDFMSPMTDYYAEVGCGITNIFKFLRLQWSWRLTQLDKPDVNPFITQASILIEF